MPTRSSASDCASNCARRKPRPATSCCSTATKAKRSPDRQGSQAEQNNRLSRHMQNCAAASACGIASALYMICSRRGVSRAELARRLEWHREQVDRLFRLDHKSRLDQMEAAFEALGLTAGRRPHSGDGEVA